MKSYKPKNMLVTGAAGFIGCNFVRFALKHHAGIRVISFDKLTYAGKKENLPEDARHVFVQGDICDKKAVDKILREYEIDTIVHFAAESHVDRSITGPAVFVQANVMGTFILLEAARNYWLEEEKHSEKKCRFHHVSTDEVYGQLGLTDPPFSETTPYHPSSPYSASKASSDHFVRAYNHTYNLPITISNCSNNYGPYQNGEKLIPTVIRSCVEQKSIPVYGNGSNIRDWLYVEDHCAAIGRIISQGITGETYNVGGNCEVDNLALVKIICRMMDEKKPLKNKHEDLISFVKDRAGHDWRYAIDNSKIKKELNWEPKFSLQEGLGETLDYYLKVK
jgi:dTDP-glucose 4,6-dehydratase